MNIDFIPGEPLLKSFLPQNEAQFRIIIGPNEQFPQGITVSRSGANFPGVPRRIWVSSATHSKIVYVVASYEMDQQSVRPATATRPKMGNYVATLKLHQEIKRQHIRRVEDE
jgi:hypothetical protein